MTRALIPAAGFLLALALLTGERVTAATESGAVDRTHRTDVLKAAPRDVRVVSICEGA